METLLRLESIRVYYGGVRALDGIDVELRAGEIIGLMGPNGAGKSTALKAVFGLAPIHSGKVYLHEKEIKPVSWRVVQVGVAFVPQGRRVFTHLTIEENLLMGGFIVRDKIELKRRIAEILETFPDLKVKLKAKAGELSGGQQQMLALARGLVVDPKIMLLDEPSLGLAPKLVKEIFKKIREINERHKTSIIVVEHNIKSITEIISRAYILDKGKVVAHGEPKKLLHEGILEKVFLGEME